MTAFFKNVALLLVSGAVALGLAEGALRIFAPRYEYAASSVHQRDSGRLIHRKPDTAYTRPHPDTGVRHPVIHNNLALRQHRDVPVEKPDGEIRIGVFGDSFTENPRVPAPYAFSEVLDRLLNATRPGFNVLNFGVDGYATDQAWLYHQSTAAARDLDVVLYVFAANDVRGLYENDLLDLDGAGRIVRKPAPAVDWWIPLVSRFYLTYLFVDVRNRLGGADSAGDDFYDPIEARVVEHMRSQRDTRTRDDTSDAIAGDFKQGVVSDTSRRWVTLLQAIAGAWRDGVESRGARFYVVLLPRPKEGLAEPLFDGFRVINLWRAFEERGLSGEPWRFRNDGHWNELGNHLAALFLYDGLAPDLGLEPLSAERIRRVMGEYYAAFGTGATPVDFVDAPEPVPTRDAALRNRYVPLEAESGER
jgi:hypothetical protein